MSNEETAPDPNSISMDDLEKLVNSTEPTISEDPLAELEMVPTQEEEAATEDETEVEAQPEEEAAKDEPKKEAEAEPEPDLPEHVKLRLEATELERKKFEALAGRHAGELGFLRKQMRELEERLTSRAEGEETYSERDDQPEKPKANDGLAEWASQQSFLQTVNGFTAQYPDADGMAEEIRDYLTNSGVDIASMSRGRDPMSVAQEARTALELAYLHVSSAKKHEAAEKAEREFARRTVDESTKLAGRRRAVAATPSGGVRASAPTKSQDPRTMPLKDLSSMIERVGSGAE